MSKHTPGPWRLGKNSDDVVVDTPAGHSEEPDHVAYYGGHLVAESICSHNRPLIAAAPDLLEVCEGLIQLRDNALEDLPAGFAFELIQKARATIAKARGEP